MIQVIEKVIHEIKKLEKAEQRKREQAKKKRKRKKMKFSSQNQEILGKMQEDVEFLEDFISFQSTQNIGQAGPKLTAVSALDYLEKRKTFWQQTVVTKN